MRRRELLAAAGALGGGLAGCTFTQPPTGTVVLDNRRRQRLSVRLVAERFGPPGGDCEGATQRRRVITASAGPGRESVLMRLPGSGTYRLAAAIRGEGAGEAESCLSFEDERRILLRADAEGLHFVEE